MGNSWAFAYALIDIDPSQASNTVPAMIKYLQTRDAINRNMAVAALRKAGPAARQAIPALVQGLTDEHYRVRQSSAFALLKIGGYETNVHPRIFAVLTDALSAKHDVQHRISTAYLLGEMGELAVEAIPALKEACTDGTQDIRKTAIEALRKIDLKVAQRREAK